MLQVICPKTFRLSGKSNYTYVPAENK